MKAVLVGSVYGDKVYYVVDAKNQNSDGYVVMESGRETKVSFFPYVSKNPKINKIRNTKFHRFLWDSPIKTTSGKWFETFIAKRTEIDKLLLDGVVVKTDLGKGVKKIKQKEKAAADFLSGMGSSAFNPETKQVVKSDVQIKSTNDRNRAWAVIKMLHQSGEQWRG